MGNLELIIGLGVVGFIFFYFAFNLSKDAEGKDSHFLLKLLLIFFALSILFLIPKAAIDSKEKCDWVVANTTTSAPDTIYNYELMCYTTTTNTEGTFLNIVLWFFRIFVFYFFIYLVYDWAIRSDRFSSLIDRWTGRR